MDDARYTFVLLDQLEVSPGATGSPLGVEGEAWHGGDFNRIWIKLEGEHSTQEPEGEGELQVLYGRLLAPFWDVQVGLRLDVHRGEGEASTRALAVLGLEGLAPYWFEVEPAVFVSQDGHVSARLAASYDLFVTQRLIAQPSIEVNGALQDSEEFGVGSGLNDIEPGLRMRFEIAREFAPYIGASWVRRFGETADLLREAGAKVSDAVFVVGVRMWN